MTDLIIFIDAGSMFESYLTLVIVRLFLRIDLIDRDLVDMLRTDFLLAETTCFSVAGLIAGHFPH